jgi:hypothetical protein
MRNTAGNFIHLSLNRRPVLTVMMVYSAGFCAVALMAAVAVWRANSSCPLSHRSEQPYVVQNLNLSQESPCAIIT